MEELENEKLLKEIKPKFNFVYELFMPTGRKLKSSLIMIIISVIITVFVSLNKNSFLDFSYNIIRSISLMDILIFFCYFMIVFSVIKFIVHFTFQKMQYEHISYKFFETYMVYEDDFLNQHKKNILYSNVKEVEIRRTIWDRILGMGVVVIYTNAENRRNNGLVVYALDNPKEDYEFIDKLINRYRINSKNVKESVKNNEEIPNDIDANKNCESNANMQEEKVLHDDVIPEQDEKSFKDSLKEIN